MDGSIYKIGTFLNPAKPLEAEEVRHVYPNTFAIEKAEGVPRLRIGASGNPAAITQSFSALLSEPQFILMVLHTSRCDSELARYQSPPLPQREVQTFFSKFSSFLECDARHDTWVHSPEENATIVLDRHNLIYVYGPIERFAASLREMGFREGPVKIPIPHTHQYHSEFDTAERQMLTHFDWSKTPLRRGDEQ